jgi:hypothetical protein
LSQIKNFSAAFSGQIIFISFPIPVKNAISKQQKYDVCPSQTIHQKATASLAANVFVCEEKMRI